MNVKTILKFFIVQPFPSTLELRRERLIDFSKGRVGFGAFTLKDSGSCLQMLTPTQRANQTVVLDAPVG
jgi:hypothetical protein